MNNRYIFRSKISETKFRRILKYFSLDIEASKIAVLTGISRNTMNRILKAIRQRIAECCELESPFERGEVEIDESYFGARWVRGIRGRGAKGKTIVFGLIKRKGKVYTQVVKNCSVKELMPIIKERVGLESVIYTDGFKSYDGLVNVGYKSTTASIMARMSSLMARTISTGSRTSGVLQKRDCLNSEEFINRTSICI